LEEELNNGKPPYHLNRNHTFGT
jgi:hypothetical protein